MCPGFDLGLCSKSHKVAMKGVSKQFGTIDAKLLCPVANFFGFLCINPETNHCHTRKCTRMTASIELHALVPVPHTF